MRFGLLFVAPLALIVTAEYPNYQLEDINFSDLVVLDSSCAVRLAQVLTRDGALQITNIPNFPTAKKEAFDGLPECLSSQPNTATMSMSDRSIRRTTAAETQSGVTGKMNSKCGENASKLRAAVEIAISQLVVALDRAVYERSMSPSSGSSISFDQQYVMKPYKSFKALVANGSHLEHLHVYSPPASGRSTIVGVKTMDFHTDSGFLVAMTRGYYSSSDQSVYSDRDTGRGLYLELSTGQRVKVDANDDALVVMIGAAASTWLEPLLGKPLRPAPHALVAGLSDAHSSVSRSWFGKMYLPPKDALLPNPEKASKQGRVRQLTYGQYREWELSGSSSQSSLPAACEISASSVQAATSSTSSPYSLLSSSNSLCPLSSGGTGVLCWMQCLPVDGLSCGTNAVCVDTVTGQEVDGSDHCPESDKSLCTLQCPVATNSTSTFDGFCYGSGVSMYMAGFASTALSGKGQTECVNLLFPRWTLDCAWKLSIGCLGTVIFAMLLQGIVRMRADIQKGRCSVLFVASLAPSYRYPLSLLLFSFQITVGYLLMLVTMTYNAELFCSVCIGLIIGHALFNQDSYKTSDRSDSADTELESQGQEGKDGEHAQNIVVAHKVSVAVAPCLPKSKEAEEPLLNGLSCCGEF